MEKILHDTLLLLGLEPKEVKFFESNFILGSATIQEITKHARLERSTSYLMASILKEKGFIIEDFKNYRKKLTTVDPTTLLRMVAAKKRRLGRQEIDMQEKLSELQALHHSSDVIPKIKVYEGATGLVSIWQNILSVQQDVLLWTNQETENKFFTPEYHNKFIADRVRKQIHLKVLAVHNPAGKTLLQDDAMTLRETKLLPEAVTFSAETYIYGHTVAIIDWNKDIFGIVIENAQIASTQKALFDLQWNRT